MKETTILNNISKLVEKIDYKTAYIEIQTKTDKYTLNKEKDTKVTGFRGY